MDKIFCMKIPNVVTSVKKHLTPRNLVKAFVEGTELSTSVAATGVAGPGASAFGQVLGPGASGWGMGIGLIQVALEGLPSMISQGRTPHNTKLVVDGVLDFAMGASTFLATAGIASVPGAVATGVLLGAKLVFDGIYKGDTQAELQAIFAKSLAGREISYWDFAGKERRITIEAKDVGRPKIGTYETYDEKTVKIHRKRAWEVPIKNGLWAAYFDIRSLKELGIQQKFQTFG